MTHQSTATASTTQQSDRPLWLRKAEPVDFPLLSQMNLELIQDEGDCNPMNVAQLQERFANFLNNDGWQVDLFIEGERVMGYATYRYEPNLAEPSGQCIQLRQFFVSRQARGSGIGKAALNLLAQERFQTGERVFLHVLETNPGGKAFWARSGFVPYATIMEWKI